MKKIVFVTNHFQYGDGVSKVLLELVNTLDNKKYDITIKVLFKIDDKFAENLNKNIKLDKVFKFYFQGFTRIIQVLPQRLLYNMIIKEKYDVEVAFQFGAPTKLMAYSKNKRAKHICWMHGYDSNMEMLKYYNMYDKVICVSKSTKEKLQEYITDKNKVDYIYNIVNDNVIKEKSNESLEIHMNYDFTFCTVGRFSKEKGFLRLIKCHKKLLDEGLMHNLIIVGDGSEKEVLLDYIKNNNLTNSVILPGMQVNPYKYIKLSDIFICSSYSEGFSTACTEAVILEKPVISTLVDGAKELIENNNCGIVVENNEEGIYNGMKLALNNKNMVNFWNENVKRESENCNLKNRKAKIEQFFDLL